MTNTTDKRAKILAMAAASVGIPAGYYSSIVNQLIAEGVLEARVVISAVGARSFRYFMVEREAA